MGNREQAKLFYNKAVEAANDKQNPTHLTHAYALFASACIMDPTWADAAYQAGNNNSDLNHLHSAIACWRRAEQCDTTLGDRAKILTNLGWRLHCLGQGEEAIKFTHQGLDCDPSLPYAWVNLSLIHGVRNECFAAVEAARKAHDIAPDDTIVQMAMAFALLFNRQFKEGLKFFESRFEYKLKDYLTYPYEKWDGSPGKTLFICNDQGMGDTLSFARFLEAVCKRSKYVHARVQPELLRAFQHAFLHIPNLNLIPGPCPFPAADAWTTFVSLPYNLDLSDDEIRAAPEINMPVMPQNPTWKMLDAKLHVGIAWAGSPLNDIDKHRCVPCIQFLDLYKVPGIQLYGMQVGERNKEMHETGCLPVIRDLTPHIRDVIDTVSILQHLDLVICCESAMVHICNAIGKEVWVPYSYLGNDWRIGHDGMDRLWSPTMRIFKQGPDCQWATVFEQIVDALRERINVAHRPAGKGRQEVRLARA